MKQLFLIPHNHNYKLSKGENRLVKFVHTDVNYIFWGWLVTVLQWRHNLKFNQNSILETIFFAMKHK